MLAYGFFWEAEEGAHINELELSAALVALDKFRTFKRRRYVLLVTESLVTALVVRN